MFIFIFVSGKLLSQQVKNVNMDQGILWPIWQWLLKFTSSNAKLLVQKQNLRCLF